MIARALKRDPLEFRKQNLLRDGRPQATGTILKDAAIEKVLDRVAEGSTGRRRSIAAAEPCGAGAGFAVALKAVISPTTSVANVIISADGSATLYCGTVDMGQGSDTAMAQMVGEVLNMPAESIRVVPRGHRRDALRYGHARLALAVPHGPPRCGLPPRRPETKIAALAREVGEAGRQQCPARRSVPQEIRYAGRQHRRHRHLQAGLHPARQRRHDRQRDAVLGWWPARASRIESGHRNWPCAHIAADQRADVGKPINPKIVETQLSGAALMQLGFTMFEEGASRWRPGHQRFRSPTTKSPAFTTCRRWKRGGRHLPEQRPVPAPRASANSPPLAS